MFRLCVILGSGGLMLVWSVLLITLVWLDPDVDPPATTGGGGALVCRGVNNRID